MNTGLKHFLTKILFITLTTIFLISCNAVKRVPEDDYLLENHKIFIDSAKTNDSKLYDQLYQTPNTKLLGSPIRLHIFNAASVNQDSLYKDWLTRKPNREKRMIRFLSKKQVDRLGVGLNGINEWLKKTGEEPSIVDQTKIKRSVKRLQAYYWNNGWFNNKTNYKLNRNDKQRATVNYYIQPNKPYHIDSLSTKIKSKVADSIYQLNKENSAVIKGKQYKTLDIETERERLTALYRNSGLFHFEKEFIKFDADTINTGQKVNLNLLIKNRPITFGDSTARIPFKVHKISKVNVFTDYSFQNRNKKPTDSMFYKGYNIYGFDKIKFTRKAITNSILINPGEIFRDRDRKKKI